MTNATADTQPPRSRSTCLVSDCLAVLACELPYPVVPRPGGQLRPTSQRSQCRASRTTRDSSGWAVRPTSLVPRRRRAPDRRPADRRPECQQASRAAYAQAHHGYSARAPGLRTANGRDRHGPDPTSTRAGSPCHTEHTSLGPRPPAASNAPGVSCERPRTRVERSSRGSFRPNRLREGEMRDSGGVAVPMRPRNTPRGWRQPLEFTQEQGSARYGGVTHGCRINASSFAHGRL